MITIITYTNLNWMRVVISLHVTFNKRLKGSLRNKDKNKYQFESQQVTSKRN